MDPDFSTNAQSDLDLGKFKARSVLYTRCQLPHAVPEKFRGETPCIFLLGQPVLMESSSAIGGVHGF